MVSVLIFTSIDFRNLSHTHKPLTRITALSSLHCAVKPSLRRNHPHRRTTIAISPGPELRRSTSITIAIAPIDGISPISREASIAASRDSDRDLARDRDRRDCDRDLTENTICPSGFSHREIDLFFWVLFEFLGMNDIMCLFGS